MKRLVSAALALSLLCGTAAYADPFGPGPRHHNGFDRGWHHRHDDGAGTAVAVGVGLLALTAIIAAADRDRERARDRAYENDYPPPPPRYRPYERSNDRPDNGYGQGYDNQTYAPDDQRQPPYDAGRSDGRDDQDDQ